MQIRDGYKISTRRACQLTRLANPSCYYKNCARDQTALTMRLKELAAAHVRYGYRRLHVLPQREGWQVNAKRVYRLYRLEGLSLRLKTNKKRGSAGRGLMPQPQR